MQQENQELQKKLIHAQQMIEALLQQVDALQNCADALQNCVEAYQESREMYVEILGYYVPDLQIGFEWKRVYLPVYDGIKSPPFSKN